MSRAADTGSVLHARNADSATVTEPPSVHVIVLDWNGLEDTMACVESLHRLHGENLTLVVVDNGSDRSPHARLAAEYPDVEVVRNQTNLGYSGGNNVGIERALARGADFVWVLNNDTTVDEGALEALLRTAARHPRAGAVGGKVLRADRPATLWMAWGRVTWLQSLIALDGKDCPDGPKYDVEREVEWIPGCSMLFRAEALREVGGFDETFFAYHEDVDWAARARAAGWQLWYNGASVIRHAVHASSGGEEASYTGFRTYLSARNSVLYAQRHGTIGQRLLMTASILLTLPFQLLRRSLRGQSRGVALKVRGWRDALAGRPLPLEDLGLLPPARKPPG